MNWLKQLSRWLTGNRELKEVVQWQPQWSHFLDEKVALALAELEPHVTMMKVLGSYPTAVL